MDRRLREKIRRLQRDPYDADLQMGVFSDLLRLNILGLSVERFTAALTGNLIEDVELFDRPDIPYEDYSHLVPSAKKRLRRRRRRKSWRTRKRKYHGPWPSNRFIDGKLPLQLSYASIYPEWGDTTPYAATSDDEVELTRLDNLRVTFMRSLIQNVPENHAHRAAMVAKGAPALEDLPRHFIRFWQALYTRILSEFTTRHRHHLEVWFRRIAILEEMNEVPMETGSLDDSLHLINSLIESADTGEAADEDQLTSLMQIFLPQSYPESFRGEEEGLPRVPGGRRRMVVGGVSYGHDRPEGLPPMTLELHCFQKAFHCLLSGIVQYHFDLARLLPEDGGEDEGELILSPFMVRLVTGGLEEDGHESKTSLYPIFNPDEDGERIHINSSRIDDYTTEEEYRFDTPDNQIGILLSNMIAIAATSLIHLEMCETADQFHKANADKWEQHRVASDQESEIEQGLINHPDVMAATEQAEARLVDFKEALAEFDTRLATGRLTREAIREIYRTAGYPSRRSRTQIPSFSHLYDLKGGIQRNLVRQQLNMEEIGVQLETAKVQTIESINREISREFNNLHPLLLEVWAAVCVDFYLRVYLGGLE